MEKLAREVKVFAVKQSSGGLSLGAMQKMGHPFARRHPKPLADPAVINVQTGQFRANWRTLVARDEALIINADRVADFLERGTKTMVNRPIQEACEDFAKKNGERILRQHLP